eukprot:gene21951-biopygen7691
MIERILTSLNSCCFLAKEFPQEGRDDSLAYRGRKTEIPVDLYRQTSPSDGPLTAGPKDRFIDFTKQCPVSDELMSRGGVRDRNRAGID